MPEPAAQPAVLDFLLTRRSHPPRLLTGPGPDRATLERLLTAALRVPDHGKLEPWRLIVIEGAARIRLADLAQARGAALGLAPERVAKTVAALRDPPVTVAVIAVPRPTDKVPEWEQVLSAGAACLSLVNAALAQGLGAVWLTGFCAYDPDFGREGLGLTAGERVAGFIHIGRSPAAPPDRPRPDLGAVVRWLAT